MLANGSIASFAGVGSDAIVDEGGQTQLFTVLNATLYVSDIGLKNGNGLDRNVTLGVAAGGAISASGVAPAVFVSGTTTFNNNIGNIGSAVSASDGAVASWNGTTSFDGSIAEGSGGAVSLQHGSSMSWSGQTSCTRNFANFGRALDSRDANFRFSGEY